MGKFASTKTCIREDSHTEKWKGTQPDPLAQLSRHSGNKAVVKSKKHTGSKPNAKFTWSDVFALNGRDD